MDLRTNKLEAGQSDRFESEEIAAQSDPFARDAHSVSEIQEREKKESEKHPGTEPAVPGNLPPERTINPLPEHPVNPQPEIPGETRRDTPEIIKLPGTDRPEWQAPQNPELPPERPEQPRSEGASEEKVVFPSFHEDPDQ